MVYLTMVVIMLGRAKKANGDVENTLFVWFSWKLFSLKIASSVFFLVTLFRAGVFYL